LGVRGASLLRRALPSGSPQVALRHQNWLVKTSLRQKKARARQRFCWTEKRQCEILSLSRAIEKNIARHPRAFPEGCVRAVVRARDKASMTRAAAWLEELGLGQYAQVLARQSTAFQPCSRARTIE
jgi:hypothetical protein